MFRHKRNVSPKLACRDENWRHFALSPTCRRHVADITSQGRWLPSPSAEVARRTKRRHLQSMFHTCSSRAQRLMCPPQGPPLQVPPVPAVHVPVLASYNQSGGYGGGYTQGRGGRNSGYGGRSAGYRRNGRGRNNRTGYGAYQGRGGAIVPYTGAAHAYPQVGGPPPRINPPHSNVTKRFNNWNACYSCGFDVADWHMSHTCNNRKPSHDEPYTRANAQMFLNRGDPHVCTAGIHKTQLPQMGPRF